MVRSLTQFGHVTYSYDSHYNVSQKKNVSNDETTSYTYDHFGNLKSVVLPGGDRVDYVVDARNRRVGRKKNGTYTSKYLYLDQLNPVAELDENNNLVSLFVYGSKSHVPDYMIKSGVKYRIISDQLGSVRFVINTNNGTTAQEISYNEWGMVLSDSNPGLQPFGYAGGIYDSDTKLVRFGARDYDASVGRWTAKDPILFAGGDTNLYRYVQSRPLNFIDPEGLRGICTRLYFSGIWMCLGSDDGSIIYRENPSNQNCYFICPQNNIRDNPPWRPSPRRDLDPPLPNPPKNNNSDENCKDN